MPKASILQFSNYSVQQLIFENIPINNNQHEFQIHPNFNMELLDKGNSKYDVKLSVEILPTEELPMPFRLSVALIGHFIYSDDNNEVSDETKEQLLRNNTVAILFPFLRQIVATLTATANIPPLILPIMNFNNEQKKGEE